MTHYPYKKVRTKTKRILKQRDKFKTRVMRYDKIEDAIRYEEETGLFYERIRFRIIDLIETWRIPEMQEHENPRPLGRLHKGYVVIQWRGKSYQAHRLAVYLKSGKWPTFYLRHKNGLRFDNRWCNLKRA